MAARTRNGSSLPLAAALVVLLAGCGGAGEPDPGAGGTAAPTPAATATRAGTAGRPTPPATGTAGDVRIDLSALAADDLAAVDGPLDVQTCLGGRCADREVDPATIGQETLSLDTTGLGPGTTLPVTVRVTAADGTVLAQQEQTITLGQGETSVAVEPLDG